MYIFRSSMPQSDIVNGVVEGESGVQVPNSERFDDVHVVNDFVGGYNFGPVAEDISHRRYKSDGEGY